jgi:hypothetical protein
MCAGPQFEVVDPQGGQLRESKAGLYSKKQDGVITATEVGAFVRLREQSVSLLAVEERHQPPCEPLLGNGEHTLD